MKRHTKRFEVRYDSTQQIEKLQSFSTSPDWKPSKITIHKTKEEARRRSERLYKKGHTTFYTDGSDINKKIEVATVSFTMGLS